MEQQNSNARQGVIAAAFKKHFLAEDVKLNSRLTDFVIGNVSGLIPQNLQVQWGLLPDHALHIKMLSPEKFKAVLISQDSDQVVENFTLRTQLEVMIENLVKPNSEEDLPSPSATTWSLLIEMGFHKEASRLAAVEAESDLEKAIELCVILQPKFANLDQFFETVQKGDLDAAVREYIQNRLQSLTTFCLLCDNMVKTPQNDKSCVCHRPLCEWQLQQINLVPPAYHYVPSLVMGLPPAFDIVSIAAGCQHSVACYENGSVYSWGSNSHGQLGNGTFVDSTIAVLLNSKVAFKQVAAGQTFTLGLSVDGLLWVWGSGRAELGLDQREELVVPKPTLIPVKENDQNVTFRSVVASVECCFAITTDNRVYMWGSDLFRSRSYVPLLIDGIRVKSVHLESKIPTAISLEGEIYKWTEKRRFTRVDTFGIPVYPKSGFESAVAFNGMMYCTAKTNEGNVTAEMTIKLSLPELHNKCSGLPWDECHVGGEYMIIKRREEVLALGSGTGIFGSREQTEAYPVPAIIPKVRNAKLIATAASHVVCVALNDRVVIGEAPEKRNKNYFVFQWGKNHGAVGVDSEEDRRAREERRLRAEELEEWKCEIPTENDDDWETLQAEVDTLTDMSELDSVAQSTVHNAVNKILNDFGVAQTDDSEFETVDLNDLCVNGEVVVKGETKINAKNSLLDTCSELKDTLAIRLDGETGRLIVDFNHPRIVIKKLREEKSVLEQLEVDVNSKDSQGHTALMLSIIDNDYELFLRLAELDADPNIPNNDHQFPLDIALKSTVPHRKAFIVALVQHGATMYSQLNKEELRQIFADAAEYFPKLNALMSVFD